MIGIAVVSLQVLLVAWSLVQPVCRLLWWIVATYAVVMTMTSVRVWDEWQAGARVTLPLVVFALLDLRLPVPVQRLLDREPLGGAGRALLSDRPVNRLKSVLRSAQPSAWKIYFTMCLHA